MLNKRLKTEYENVKLPPEMSNLIATMIASDDLMLKVLRVIAKTDRLLLNYEEIKKNPDVKIEDEVKYGITKENLRKSLYLGKRKALTGEHKGKMVDGYPAIKKIDSIMTFLMGTSIVYYEKNSEKEKRFLYTRRALPVLTILCKKGHLNSNELFPNKQE